MTTFIGDNLNLNNKISRGYKVGFELLPTNKTNNEWQAFQIVIYNLTKNPTNTYNIQIDLDETQSDFVVPVIYPLYINSSTTNNTVRYTWNITRSESSAKKFKVLRRSNLESEESVTFEYNDEHLM